MLTPQREPLSLTKNDKAKLSAYLNGASFLIDSDGREKFIPRIETVEDDLKVVYLAERSGPDRVRLEMSIAVKSTSQLYNLTDFVLDLVDYSNDQRVTGELDTRRTLRAFPGLYFNRTYSIVPHGDEGGSEVRDPARRPPPELSEAELPRRQVESYDGVHSGALSAARR